MPQRPTLPPRSAPPSVAPAAPAGPAGPVAPTASVVPSAPVAAPAQATVDLADNVAGAAVRAKRDEVNAKAPVFNLVARLFGVRTEERSWRVGAKGEEKVGKELAKLPDGWRVLHAVVVSAAGTDIDHVVIGPGGVFTLNTKRHPEAKLTVYEHALYINGHKETGYLRKSRAEARRAAGLLGAACGSTVPVQPLLVFVDLAEFKVKRPPADVTITTTMRLNRFLLDQPQRWNPEQVETMYGHARLSTTWLPG